MLGTFFVAQTSIVVGLMLNHPVAPRQSALKSVGEVVVGDVSGDGELGSFEWKGERSSAHPRRQGLVWVAVDRLEKFERGLALDRIAIRQRGPQSWELKFDLGRDPVSGKRQSRHVTFKGTKQEAQAELNRLLSRRNEGTYVDPTKMSVAEYLEHWLSADIERRVAAKTANRHRGIVRHQISPRIGHIPMRKLSAVHIEAFETQLQRNGYVKGKKRGRSLTAQTVLHVHRALSQALGHAVRTGVLFKNPAEQVKPPRPPRQEIAMLTKPEVATLLRAAEATSLYLHLPILVGVTTGTRPS